MLRRVLVFSALLVAVAPAAVLTTTDGDTLEGDVKKTDKGYTVTAADGTVTAVETRRVKSIELGTSATPSDRSMAALQSLRRSVEYGDDLGRIIQRYQTFLGQSYPPATLAAARDDLKTWQGRQRDGLVKVGHQWVTPAERERVVRQSRDDAERARLLIKAGHPDLAARLIAAGLEQQPNNPSFLYLLGVLAMQRSDLNEAKRDFTAVQQAVPQHAPTLLNLSVIALKQHQWGEACALLDQALAAAPVTQPLLDATAEFIRLVPATQGRTMIGQRLSKRFVQQDGQLQQSLARSHWYRWGSTWIDQSTHDKIEADVAAGEAKVKQIQGDFDDAQQQLAGKDQQINANADAMRTLEQHRFVRAADGTTVRLPLTQSYYDLQDENKRLATQRDDLNAKLETLRGLAQGVRSAMPQPRYTGVVTPIGEDGVPLANLPPTSGPTTQND